MGKAHRLSPARQRVPNEIHLFETRYIITLSGPPRGTPRLPLGLFQNSRPADGPAVWLALAATSLPAAAPAAPAAACAMAFCAPGPPPTRAPQT